MNGEIQQRGALVVNDDFDPLFSGHFAEVLSCRLKLLGESHRGVVHCVIEVYGVACEEVRVRRCKESILAEGAVKVGNVQEVPCLWLCLAPGGPGLQVAAVDRAQPGRVWHHVEMFNLFTEHEVPHDLLYVGDGEMQDTRGLSINPRLAQGIVDVWVAFGRDSLFDFPARELMPVPSMRSKRVVVNPRDFSQALHSKKVLASSSLPVRQTRQAQELFPKGWLSQISTGRLFPRAVAR
eukprot:CAMPEP_0117663830 /NCGR_PEP_ID=MMETSP0804-20121206/8839_1 /TAXON_ID=1074897 /ORGANISM="Tetraselmis astigmatica, Strain CCMP880" /LENGTH=236 /DNA_ID=CAMNT_0005470909 /DNA_START=744 /DNA_END=1455 /DNA_ORIENTATION=+